VRLQRAGIRNPSVKLSSQIAAGRKVRYLLLPLRTDPTAEFAVSRLRRQVGKQTWRHLHREILEEPAWLGDVAVPDLDEREVVGAEPPVGDDLDKKAFPDEPGLDDWRKLPDPGPCG